jgi:hypothetical protein
METEARRCSLLSSALLSPLLCSLLTARAVAPTRHLLRLLQPPPHHWEPRQRADARVVRKEVVARTGPCRRLVSLCFHRWPPLPPLPACTCTWERERATGERKGHDRWAQWRHFYFYLLTGLPHRRHVCNLKSRPLHCCMKKKVAPLLLECKFVAPFLHGPWAVAAVNIYRAVTGAVNSSPLVQPITQ